MKKKIIPFLMLISILFISCKQAAFEKLKVPQGYGTVIIGIGGAEARAIGENGLPVLESSEMTIKVTKDDGSPIQEKTFAESENPKSLSLFLPIGEKIIVAVTVKNVLAQWSGEEHHTVTAGPNTVSVKLKKSAVALNNLLFGTDKPHGAHSGGASDYTLMLKIASKEVKKEHIVYHNFCCDNKARTYFVYQEPSNCKLERYTSEGNREDKTFTLPAGCRSPMLAEDHATGAVYLVAKDGLNMKLYRINEVGGSPIELTGIALGYIESCAVYNNVLIASGYGMTGRELKMYRINEDLFSEITLSAQPDLSEDTKIAFDTSGHYMHGKINSLYMTEDSFYLLFSGYEHSAQHFSLGGIVKYSYSADGTISKIKRIGIADAHTSDGNGIYPTNESNFYGPVKVIGFDEQNLYIADDGVKFEFQKGKPRITANKNRIATLNKGTNVPTFTDAPSGITWVGENPVWTGVNTKTIVWKKNAELFNNYGVIGFDYYQLDEYNSTSTTPLAASDPDSTDQYFTDVFCFDEAGNLYIVKIAFASYYVYRFELKDDGSYDSSTDVMVDLPNQPVAIAVDISGSVTKPDGTPVNALYCSYDDHDKSYIKRSTWAKNAAFSTATADGSFVNGTGHPTGTFEGHQDDPINKTKTRFTALAADKNGFYVGEIFEDTGNKKYAISVKKYAHDATGYADTTGSIEVVPETVYYSSIGSTTEFSLSENINALSIQDGILYGVTAKEFKNEYNSDNHSQKASISGKLWKIGKTDAAFTTDTLKCLRSSEPNPLSGNDDERKEGGKFAPYRFIAVKPKKLIIASDGFYGYVENSTPPSRQISQYNFIWTFELNEDGSIGDYNPADKEGTGITFSKELQDQSGFPWE